MIEEYNMDFEIDDLQQFRVKTLNIAVPERLYQEMFKRGMIRRVNQIVVDHFIDMIKNDYQELNGMGRNRKQY